MRDSGQRYVIVTAYPPRADSGRALRTLGVASALSRLCDVEVRYVDRSGQGPSAEWRRLDHVPLREVVPRRGVDRAFSYTQARLHGIPDGYARGVSRELVRALVRAGLRDHLIADGPIPAAAMMTPRASGHPFIYNAQNVESALAAERGEGEAVTRRLARFERSLLMLATETWVPSRRDVDRAREIAPAAAIRYVPNVVDVAAIHPVGVNSSSEILYVGDFSYLPNRQALSYLVTDVMPRLWSTRPEARLVVVGRGSRFVSSDPRIMLCGYAKDLRGFYERARCVAVPLLTSGGSPLKFVEAMAYGVPVVATSTAAGGLDVSHGEHCLLAANAAEFASALAVVLRDGAEAMAVRARALVEREYSVSALARALS